MVDFLDADSDPAEFEKRNKEQIFRQEKFNQFHLDDWRTVLQTPAGRAVMGQLMLFCRTLEADAESNPASMGYREGLRAAGLYTMDQIRKASPGKYLDVLREAESIANFFTTEPVAKLSKARDFLSK